jgi:hypothetical protein
MNTFKIKMTVAIIGLSLVLVLQELTDGLVDEGPKEGE